ncbi:MAG: type II toxin-antitoxin system MqsA family antitoxin [Sphaerobacteraceae bacterium]|nr:MAG: type II toxin-antitoxin system MqsA family antitoxin [Sphaerobacteraceae bacterium]
MSHQQAHTNYMDTCAECGSATERVTTTVDYELEGLSITVKNVPASVCPSCGEKYIPGAVGIAIHRQVRKFVTAAHENSVTEGHVTLTAEHNDEQAQYTTA